MRILFVRPPHASPVLKFLYSSEPLGLESVAAAVADHDLAMFDMRVDGHPLGTVLRDFRPDVVGISGFTPDVHNMQRILGELKRINPDVRTVVGGHHASIAPEDFQLPTVDAVVMGLGEETFGDLVDAMDSGQTLEEVPGLAIPSPDGLFFTKERPLPKTLDDLPLPFRDLNLPYRKRYTLYGSPLGMINTARGCPFRCRFCSIINEMKGRYVTKSPDRVVEELSGIEQPFIRFADGNTFGDVRRMRELAEAIRAAGIHKRYLFDIRSDTVARNPDIIATWREIGLEYAAVGLESPSDAYLATLGKGATVADNRKALKILRDNGVKVLGQFMIDPSFEREDFENMIAFVLDNEIHLPTFLLTTPFPGTELHTEVKDQILTKDYTKFDCFHALTPTVLDKETFFRCFFGLYEEAYSYERLGRRLMSGFLGEQKDDVSALKLMAIRTLLGLKKSQLLQEFLSV